MDNGGMRRISKAVAAFGAAAAVMVAAGLITGDLAAWVTGAVTAVTTFIAVYLAPPNSAAPVGGAGMLPPT